MYASTQTEQEIANKQCLLAIPCKDQKVMDGHRETVYPQQTQFSRI